MCIRDRGSSRRSPRSPSRLERGHPSPYPTPLGTNPPSALTMRPPEVQPDLRLCLCNNGITQFYLPLTHDPYLPLLPSRKASPPFGRYSLRLPTKGWPGWVDLGGWLHTEINVPHRKLNPDTVTVTHLSTNRARRKLTPWIKINVLPLSQTTIWPPSSSSSSSSSTAVAVAVASVLLST